MMSRKNDVDLGCLITRSAKFMPLSVTEKYCAVLVLPRCAAAGDLPFGGIGGMGTSLAPGVIGEGVTGRVSGWAIGAMGGGSVAPVP